MDIPVIINYKTRTGLAIKYPMGKIEEVILQEDKTLIGTCGDCDAWVKGFDYCSRRKKHEWYKDDGCIHWKDKCVNFDDEDGCNK